MTKDQRKAYLLKNSWKFQPEYVKPWQRTLGHLRYTFLGAFRSQQSQDARCERDGRAMTETFVYVGLNDRLSVRLNKYCLTIKTESDRSDGYQTVTKAAFHFTDDRAEDIAAVFSESARLLRDRHEAVYGEIVRQQTAHLQAAGWFRRTTDSWVHERHPKATFTFTAAVEDQRLHDEKQASEAKA